MKKTLLLIFGVLVAFSAVCQVPALNEIVKTTTLSPARVGAALEVGEVYTASGTDTYTVAMSVLGLYSGSATYASGDKFTIIFTNANTVTTPTININSEGAKTIVDRKGDAVAAGDIEGVLILTYDGTNFRVIGGTGAGGGGGSVTSVSGTADRITSSGGVTPSIDISTTFEALLSKRAERIDQNNAATTSAQLATTVTDETGDNGGFVRANSPTLTGSPVLPSGTTGVTQSAGTNNTTLSTTAYTDAKVAASITNGVTGSAPNQDQVFDALALKADLVSPTFTGTPAAPTAAGSTNTTQLATTAFVKTSSPKVFQFACSDEVTAITTGAGKISFRIPYAMTVTAVRASLVTAQSSGSTFTVDINEGGTTILSTKITLDNTESTSTTAATPAVISDTTLADDAVITVDVDQVGNGTAIGLKVTLIGY